MIKTYNKQQLLEPLMSGYPNIFEELKNIIKNDVTNGDQVKIITQTEGFPIEEVVHLTTIQEVENWIKNFELD